MIWKAKKKPEIGDVRVVTRFAWFPTAVTLGSDFDNYTHVVWWQRYEERQEYRRIRRWVGWETYLCTVGRYG